MIAKTRNLLKDLENKVKEISQKVTGIQGDRKLKKKSWETYKINPGYIIFK